jgi:hypothetical protein
MGETLSTGGETGNRSATNRGFEMEEQGAEEQLREAVAGYEVGSQDTVRRQDGGARSLVLGDSIIWNV